MAYTEMVVPTAAAPTPKLCAQQTASQTADGDMPSHEQESQQALQASIATGTTQQLAVQCE